MTKLTIRQERDLLEKAFEEICDELRCPYNNEAALMAIHELKERIRYLEKQEESIDEGEPPYGDPGGGIMWDDTFWK